MHKVNNEYIQNLLLMVTRPCTQT